MPRQKAKAENAELATTETAIKQKRSWVPNPQKDFGQENVEPGDNSRYLRFSRLLSDLPPIDISDEEQVRERIDQYLDYCEQNDMKPGMATMASALGIDRSTLNSWARGECRGATHSPVIKKKIAMLEGLWENYMQNGKINPTSGIFLAKNQFGYRDVIDIAPTTAPPLGEIPDQKALEERINGSVVED